MQQAFLTTKKDEITTGDKEKLDTKTTVDCVGKSDVGEKNLTGKRKNKIKKRITSLKRTTKVKKTTLFFSKPCRGYKRMKIILK